MAVVQTQIEVAERHCDLPVVRIDARSGWLALDLAELWAYRELLYFFVWPEILQFWMFAYPSSLAPAKWHGLYGLNPMAGVIEGFRWLLTGHGQPPGVLMAASSVAVGLLVLGGLIYYHAVEGKIADVV
jgi:lipopolysaccharide transport system permease protein